MQKCTAQLINRHSKSFGCGQQVIRGGLLSGAFVTGKAPICLPRTNCRTVVWQGAYDCMARGIRPHGNWCKTGKAMVCSWRSSRWFYLFLRDCLAVTWKRCTFAPLFGVIAGRKKSGLLCCVGTITILNYKLQWI